MSDNEAERQKMLDGLSGMFFLILTKKCEGPAEAFAVLIDVLAKVLVAEDSPEKDEEAYELIIDSVKTLAAEYRRMFAERNAAN